MKREPWRPMLVPGSPPRPPREPLPEGSAPGALTPDAALQQSCARVCENLRDAMGLDGCAALLDRAIAMTAPAHPGVRVLRTDDEDGPHLEGVAACVAAHGLPATSVAVDALMAALLAVLGRVIGRDMAERFVDHVPAPRAADRRSPEGPA